MRRWVEVEEGFDVPAHGSLSGSVARDFLADVENFGAPPLGVPDVISTIVP